MWTYSNNMYFVVILCAAFVVASADRVVIQLPHTLYEELEPLIKKCILENNAPSDVLSKMLTGVIETEASLKFTYCYLTQAGYVNKDGRFNISKMIFVVEDAETKDKYKNVLENCNKATGDNHLEVLREVAECYKANSPVYFTFA